jgi:hypothetical protein
VGRADEVQVFETLSGRWVGGYELADAQTGVDSHLLRRQSDGVILPERISSDRIRPAHSGPRAQPPAEA